LVLGTDDDVPSWPRSWCGRFDVDEGRVPDPYPARVRIRSVAIGTEVGDPDLESSCCVPMAPRVRSGWHSVALETG
jgi:hypothetical protein